MTLTERPPILALRQVSFRRKGRLILSGVSLTLREGEIFCLLGPSGSGKTTLLRIIAGLLAPTSGIVEIQGRDQAATPTHKRNIGFVFQDPSALLPHLTVAENVAFPLRIHRARNQPSTKIDSLVNQTLAAVMLTDKSDRRPHELSGGERQRVALARAFVYEPTLLLLDEPLNSLDNITKSELIPYISDLRKQFRTTCLHVTHDEREAVQLADRIGILVAGRILSEGNADEVFGNPINVAVARLSAEWNIITGEVRGANIELPPGSMPAAVPAASIPGPRGSGSSVLLGFPIRAATLAPAGADTIVFAGTLAAAYRTDGGLEVSVRVGQDRFKLRWPSATPVPAPGGTVHLAIPTTSLRRLGVDT